MGLILLIVVLLLLFGGLPQMGFHDYGYGPSGLFGFLLLLLLILFILGLI